jgi:tetratricopeptide (TPR) repeat protein
VNFSPYYVRRIFRRKKRLDWREAAVISDRPMHRDEYNRDEFPNESKPDRPDFNKVFAKELGKQPNDWMDGMKPHRLINYTVSEDLLKAAALEADRLTTMLNRPEISPESLYIQWEKTALLHHALRHQSHYVSLTEQTKDALVARLGATSWRIRDFLRFAYQDAKKINFREAHLKIAHMIVDSLTTKEAHQQWGDIDKAELARCLLAVGKQPEALSCVEQAWACALADEDSPKAYRCAMLAGDIAMRTGDFPKAAIYFQYVLQELTKRPRANAQAITNLKAKLGEVRV